MCGQGRVDRNEREGKTKRGRPLLRVQYEGLGSKKFSPIHGGSEKSLSKKQSIAKERLSSAKDFPVCVHVYARNQGPYYSLEPI